MMTPRSSFFSGGENDSYSAMLRELRPSSFEISSTRELGQTMTAAVEDRGGLPGQ